MSIRVMSRVWDHARAQGIDRLVLLAIADSASDDGGNAWPSIATLARKAGIDTRTVQRSIRRLVESGELEMRSNAGRRGANVYRVTVDNSAESVDEPLAERHPWQSATPAERRTTPGTVPPQPPAERLPNRPLTVQSREGARERATPPHRCIRHKDLADDDPGPPCLGCKRAREDAERTAADAADAEKRQRRAAIEACPVCDDRGLVDLGDSVKRCTHDREATG